MEEKMEDYINRYSSVNLKQLTEDFRDNWKVPLIMFIVPMVVSALIFMFVDKGSNVIGIGFLFGLWAIYGFFLLTKPLYLRVIIPILIGIIQVFILLIMIFQYFLAAISEYIEKNLKEFI